MATESRRKNVHRLGCSVCGLKNSPYAQPLSMPKFARSGGPAKTQKTFRNVINHTPRKLNGGVTSTSDVSMLQRDKEELKNMLQKYKCSLSETQANMELLKAERDSITLHYRQAQDEILALQHELMSKSMMGASSTVGIQGLLSHMEIERDEARSDLHRITSEKNALRERLKISQETAIRERSQLEQRIKELQSAMLTLEQERDKQFNAHTHMKETIMLLEKEVNMLSKKLAASQEEADHFKSEYSLFSQLKDELKSSQRRLTAKIGELLDAHERNKQLDERNDALVKMVTTLKQKMSVLYGNVSKLEHDKEVLREELKTNNRLLNSTNKQLEDKETTIHALNLQIGDDKTFIKALKETLRNQDEELDITRMKFSSSEAELLALMKVKEITLRDYGQLKDKLSKAELDKQALQLKIDKGNKEIKDLELKIKSYLSDMSATEDHLSSKELECREMWKLWRQTSIQAERWEKQAKQAEAAVINLRLELNSSVAEKIELEEKLAILENSLQKAQNADKKNGAELVQLNRTLRKREEELKQAHNEQSHNQHDLEKTRELCVKLNADRELVLQEANAYRSEVEFLRKQLESEQTFRRVMLTTRELEL